MEQPISDVLILTICSFRKRTDGRPGYSEDAAVTQRLPAKHGGWLRGQRNEVCRWLLRHTELRWRGQTLRDIRYNQSLKCAADLGGQHHSGATYLRAVYRYQGRLYQALGAEGKRAVLGTRHHVLFVSGLYGVVAPGELIQCYSCPLDVHWADFTMWARTSPTLTDILVGYVEEQGIRKVLDLTANRTYRDLVDWRRLRQALGGDRAAVLHCFAKTAAGDDALPVFGHLLRHHLLEDEALGKLGANTKDPFRGKEEVAFMSRPMPPPEWPREVAPPCRDLDDEVDRARRGVIRFLDHVEGRRAEGSEDLRPRIERLASATNVSFGEPEAESARTVNRARNDVVYRRRDVEGQLLTELRRAAEHLKARASKRGFDIPELDTDWDEVLGR